MKSFLLLVDKQVRNVGGWQASCLVDNGEGVMGDHGPFAVEAYRSKGRDVIRLCGELDLSSAPMVAAVLDRMWVIPDHLVFEVSGLDLVDSTGLKVLIRASQLVDGRIALVGAGDQLRLLLEITAMTDRFHLVTDAEAAHDLFRVRRANFSRAVLSAGSSSLKLCSWDR